MKLKTYLNMTRDELLKEKEVLEEQYKKVQEKHLNLNMSRGKPSSEQLDLSMPMMDFLNGNYKEIITELESKMQQASDEMNFEKEMAEHISPRTCGVRRKNPCSHRSR